MTTPSAAIVLQLWSGWRRRPARLAAAALGALLAAAPAAAQTPCPGDGWSALSVTNYSFSFLSRRQGTGSAATSLNCVRNNHASRGVYVDWRGAGLRSAIPPGQTIFRTSPLGGNAAARRHPFFYGARPNVMSVLTVASLDGSAPALAVPAAGGLFRRASFWQGAAAPAGSGSNASVVYLPMASGFLASFVRESWSPRRLIELVERFPNILEPFSMTFDNNVTVDASGQVVIAYECRYRAPSFGRGEEQLMYVRFSDAALHRRMFGNDEPFPIGRWGEGETVLRAAVPALDPGLVAARTAQLEIVLADRRTVIAAIPVSYSAPAS